MNPHVFMYTAYADTAPQQIAYQRAYALCLSCIGGQTDRAAARKHDELAVWTDRPAPACGRRCRRMFWMWFVFSFFFFYPLVYFFGADKCIIILHLSGVICLRDSSGLTGGHTGYLLKHQLFSAHLTASSLTNSSRYICFAQRLQSETQLMQSELP